jgi:hypothetical protein
MEAAKLLAEPTKLVDLKLSQQAAALSKALLSTIQCLFALMPPTGPHILVAFSATVERI